MTLKDFFKEHKKAAVAFSGGVDSAFLLYEAVKNGAEVAAYTIKSEFQPDFELRDAEDFAAALGVRLTVIDAGALACPEIRANGPERCYHCKKNNFGLVLRRARQDGFETLLDGTNASDDEGDRPGARAAAELGVLSPLKLCGVTKAQIRGGLRRAGFALWEKPSYSCLATRIPRGTEITAEALERVERGEGALFALGFSGFRLRAARGAARLELPEGQFAALLEKRGEVLSALLPYFETVCLDLAPREVT